MYKHVNILNISRKVPYVYHQSVLSKCIVKATKAVFWPCSGKKLFGKISRNSEEENCIGISVFIKLQAPAQVFLRILRNFSKQLSTNLWTATSETV